VILSAADASHGVLRRLSDLPQRMRAVNRVSPQPPTLNESRQLPETPLTDVFAVPDGSVDHVPKRESLRTPLRGRTLQPARAAHLANVQRQSTARSRFRFGQAQLSNQPTRSRSHSCLQFSPPPCLPSESPRSHRATARHRKVGCRLPHVRG
jgi:hypothetical protein